MCVTREFDPAWAVGRYLTGCELWALGVTGSQDPGQVFAGLSRLCVAMTLCCCFFSVLSPLVGTTAALMPAGGRGFQKCPRLGERSACECLHPPGMRVSVPKAACAMVGVTAKGPGSG